ncbi:MAG: UDP-N-acetylmuramoyl-tripeptide--D-alanyl-D-alanine ligase [Oscillospiraceae bacterium]|nr:UDP-N-acetylmuramoyl-tripeptide--D-alanyl-D-alanine ligase [Oscillospiraceae bacterium]
MIELDDILKATDGKVINRGKSFYYKNFSIDTRTIEKDDFFIAIKGEKFNGNDFVKKAFTKGASVSMVDEDRFDKHDLNDANWLILVKDCRKALIDLASFYRNKLNIKVIAVTGSVGKTTTKDLIHGVVSSKYKAFKTKGNYNNSLGLPLSILSIDESYEACVLELGMNHKGEIDLLSKISKPDLAVITNIGTAHIEFLKSRKNILSAKMEITNYFTNENKLIINGDNDLLSTIKKEEKDYEIITCGFNLSNDCIISKESYSKDKIEFDFSYSSNKYKFKLNGFYGKHSILNASLAICVGFTLGLNEEEIQTGLNNVEITPMRMEIDMQNDITIIDDCYNASPDSMKAAIDVLSNYKEKRRIALLGTMGELGNLSFKSHEEIGSYAKNKVDMLVTFSKYNEYYKKGYGNKIFSFNNINDLYSFVLREVKKDDVILVKASRAEKYENIVRMLKNNLFGN